MHLDNVIMIFALRYALGRKSTAPGIMVDAIIKYWHKFDEWEQQQIKKEIREAIDLGRAGMDMDVEMWRRLL